MLSLSIFFLLLTIQSCKTLYRLPADEVLPYLDNKEDAIVDLLFLHYQWKLWANDSRFIVGEISKYDRNRIRKSILDELSNMDYN